MKNGISSIAPTIWLSIQTPLTLFLLFFFSIQGMAQTTLFEHQPITTSEVSSVQQAFINRMNTNYEAISSTLVTIEKITETQDDGIIDFTLPSGEILTAIAYRVNYGEEETLIWTGKIGEEGDMISLAQNAGATAGMIVYQDKFYSIHPIDATNSLMIESDRSVHEDITCALESGATAQGFFRSSECLPTACGSPVIDVLTVWTDEAIAFINGLGNDFIVAVYVALGLESVNIAFDNSDIDGEVRFNIIRYSDFAFDSQGDIIEDITTLTTDPFIINAREEFSSDLVVLMTNQGYFIGSNQVFGIVNAIEPSINTAFSIVEVPFLISPRWTFAHEVAHLFGARHNRSANVPCPSFAPRCGDDTDICAHAWRFVGNSGAESRTILASLSSTQGERILHYSNPDVRVDGTDTGTDDDDNAGRISHTACGVTEYFPPSQLTARIVGSPFLCRCLPFPPQTGTYIELLDYRVDVTAPSGPFPGLPPYSYEWKVNTSGIFNRQNSGTLIGTAETVTIPRPFICHQFFLHIRVTSSDGAVATHTRRIVSTQCIGCNIPSCVGGEIGDSYGTQSVNIIHQSFYDDTSFTIFPNPAKGIVSLNIVPNQQKIREINITDVSGRNIHTINIQQGDTSLTYQIPLTNVPPGLYFCTVQFDGITKTRKLIVQ